MSAAAAAPDPSPGLPPAAPSTPAPLSTPAPAVPDVAPVPLLPLPAVAEWNDRLIAAAAALRDALDGLVEVESLAEQTRVRVLRAHSEISMLLVHLPVPTPQGEPR